MTGEHYIVRLGNAELSKRHETLNDVFPADAWIDLLR